MSLFKLIWRFFFPMLLDYAAIRKLHSLKERGRIALEQYRYKTPYILERVEEYTEYARDWDRIATRYAYLADILTHEYLNDHPTMTDRERQIAFECHRRVGDFLRICRDYRDAKTQNVFEPKPMREEVVINN